MNNTETFTAYISNTENHFNVTYKDSNNSK